MSHLPTLAIVLLVAAAAARAQAPPRVVRLDPPHLATDLDAASVQRLVVRFDAAMDPGVYGLCGGGPSFPSVAAPTWDDAHTFGLDVTLAPDHVYAMDLACAESAGFRSAAGQRLRPLPWRIATKGPNLPDGAARAAVDRLFVLLRERYSYRDRLGIDWSALDRAHRDQLEGCRNGAALALRIGDLLTTAQDVHVTVQWQDATLPTFRRDVVANFDARALQAALPDLVKIGRIGLSARTDDGIGYLFVGSFAREERDDFERVLDVLRTRLQDCKALVLDLRTNGGGDEQLAQRLAACFVDGDVVYAAHRLCDPRAGDGFGERQDRRLRGNDAPDRFPGPVAVLTGPLNMSSCEAFLLMMKQSPRALLVGETSYGSSGNPQPHVLLPGLVVTLPSWQALRPDGSCFEGEGITPHLHVATQPADFAAGDPVLEAALLRLRGGR
ncbi:MAG: hypothetical protein JNM25_13820 [Planctomycetes bacterium]|nr:hypothetical protein [Planctomycetota bacterium]